MNLTKAVPVIIPSVLTDTMTDVLVSVSPGVQAVVDAVFIAVDKASLADVALDNRFDGFLLHVIQHLDKHLPASLKYAEHGWLVFSSSATTPSPFKSASTSMTSFSCNALPMPFMSCHDIDLIHLYDTAEFRFFFLATTPSRSCLVMR